MLLNKLRMILLIIFWWRFLLLKADDDVCVGYKKTIKIVRNVTECTQVSTNNFRCPNLEAALDLYPFLIDTCVELGSKENLTAVYVFHDSRKVKITSSTVESTIECQDMNSGISFIGGAGIQMTKLSFSKCGGQHESYYRHTNYVGQNQTLYKMNLTAVLNFEGITDIKMDHIIIQVFRGFAIVMTDCIGHTQFSDLTLDTNKLAPCVFENFKNTTFYFGGGIMLRHISDDVLDGATFDIYGKSPINSINNIKAINFTTIRPDDISVFTDLKPFGCGGGISMYFYRSTRNTINLSPKSVAQNLGLYGGGFYLYHGEDSTNNIIKLTKLKNIDQNIAYYGGGFMYYVNVKYPYQNNNTLILQDFYSVSRNVALYGFGGFFCNFKAQSGEKHGFIDQSYVKTFFKGEFGDINNNNAKLGSVFFFESSFIKFEDNIIINSNNPSVLPDQSNGFGAVYLFKSYLFLDGKTTFMKNQMTGLVLDFSYIYLYGKLDFDANLGTKGGAMALFGQSQLIIDDVEAHLTIRNNKANQGAGIYVHYSGPFASVWNSYYLPVYDCFIRFTAPSDKARIIFKKNNIGDIFASSLLPCANSDKLVNFFLNSTEFNFNGKTNPISTDPINIDLPDDPIWSNMYPGKITVPIKLFDEIGNTVSAPVKLTIKDTNGVTIALENGHNNLFVFDDKVEFKLLIHKSRASFVLEFSVDNVVANPQNRKAKFTHCLFGYTFRKNQCKCEPVVNNKYGIVDCNQETGDIYVFSNLWFNPKEENSMIDGITCPNGYCRECNNIGENKVNCKFNKTNQCQAGRDQLSYLCSECEKGKQLTWGGESCVDDCSVGKTAGAIAVLLVVLIIIFFSIVFFNIDVYESYLTPVIFFYQVARLLLTTTQDYDSVMHFIFALCNFEGAGSTAPWSVCFGTNFNENWKTIASLLIIVVSFALWWAAINLRSVVHIKNKDTWIGNLTSVTYYRAAVFIIMYLYGVLVQVCFNGINILHRDGDGFRLYIDASSHLFHERGSVYLYVVCVIILILALLMLPCMILLNFADFLRHVCYLFKSPFRNEKSFFPIYYLFFVFIFKLLHFIMILFNTEKQITLTVFSIFAVFIFIIFTSWQPYKKKSGSILSLNTFDSFILFVLCLVGIISNGKQKIPSLNVMDGALDTVIRVILWIPVGSCIILNFIRLGGFVVWIHKRRGDIGFWRTLKKYCAGAVIEMQNSNVE